MVETSRQKRFVAKLLRILIPEYDQSNAPWEEYARTRKQSLIHLTLPHLFVRVLLRTRLTPFSANVPSLTKPDLCIFIRAIPEKYFGESMCVFALEKSTERLKKTQNGLSLRAGSLVNRRLGSPSSLFVWETRKKIAWSRVSSLVRVRERARRIGRETRTSVPARRLAMTGHNPLSHWAKPSGPYSLKGG